MLIIIFGVQNKIWSTSFPSFFQGGENQLKLVGWLILQEKEPPRLPPAGGSHSSLAFKEAGQEEKFVLIKTLAVKYFLSG